MRDVPALILAGGLGTRLRGVVPDRPKVLARVTGRPFLAFLLDALAEAGVRDVILCTGYRAEQVEQEFGRRYGKLSLRYSRETQPLGTGGALRQALTLTEEETVLALNGDSFVTCDLAAFYAWHRTHGFASTLVLAEVENSARFGTVHTDQQGVIYSFEEKHGRAEPGWINAGVYLMRRAMLETLPQGEAISLEHGVFPAWLSGGLGGYRSDGSFLDIGTPKSFAEAETFLAGLGATS
jgi:NDP-sugar pyrophosphorylase family protein